MKLLVSFVGAQLASAICTYRAEDAFAQIASGPRAGSSAVDVQESRPDPNDPHADVTTFYFNDFEHLEFRTHKMSEVDDPTVHNHVGSFWAHVITGGGYKNILLQEDNRSFDSSQEIRAGHGTDLFQLLTNPLHSEAAGPHLGKRPPVELIRSPNGGASVRAGESYYMKNTEFHQLEFLKPEQGSSVSIFLRAYKGHDAASKVYRKAGLWRDASQLDTDAAVDGVFKSYKGDFAGFRQAWVKLQNGVCGYDKMPKEWAVNSISGRRHLRTWSTDAHELFDLNHDLPYTRTSRNDLLETRVCGLSDLRGLAPAKKFVTAATNSSGQTQKTMEANAALDEVVCRNMQDLKSDPGEIESEADRIRLRIQEPAFATSFQSNEGSEKGPVMRVLENHLDKYGVTIDKMADWKGLTEIATGYISESLWVRAKRVRDRTVSPIASDFVLRSEVHDLRKLFWPDMVRSIADLAKSESLTLEGIPPVPVYDSEGEKVLVKAKFYVTADLVVGLERETYFLWHMDRGTATCQDQGYVRGGEKYPITYQGFVYYSGLPTWFMVKGNAKNAIEFLQDETDAKHDVIAVWFNSPWHAVPKPDESVSYGSRIMLRVKLTAVPADI